MSVKAVGAYIRTLRKLRQLTELAVSTEAGVGANYIWRIENGEIDRPSAENLAAITRAVSGRLEDVGNLLLDKAATREDGEHLAERCLRATDETMQNYLVALPPGELHDIVRVIRRIQHDPAKLHRLRGYLDALVPPEQVPADNSTTPPDQGE